MTPKQWLKDEGWNNYYNCQTCKGRVSYFNKKDYPGIDIAVNNKNQTVRILRRNDLVLGPISGGSLPKQITEIIPDYYGDKKAN